MVLLSYIVTAAVVGFMVYKFVVKSKSAAGTQDPVVKDQPNGSKIP